MMKSLTNTIIRHRVIGVAIFLLLTLFLGYEVTQVKLNPDLSTYLAGGSVVDKYNVIGEEYGGKSIGLVMIEVEDVFTLKTLEMIRNLTDAYEELEGVAYVTSLTNVLDFKKTEWGFEVGRLIPAENIPETKDELDLKVGKQRIAWGTADKFNPTDNLNPNDLTDFLDFEAKVPSLALKASYYIGDYTVTGVWVPIFEPALFPRGGTQALLGKMPDRVEVPARTPENGMFAIKLSGTAFNLDYSLSYFKGFDDIPIEFDNSEGLEMGFPEMQVVGFDFAGEFHSVGFWGEVALFFPEEIKSGQDVILSNEPYLKYTFGIDYTFENGIYLEAQYVHGFFTERGRGNLSNFLLVSIERKFLNDDLTLSLSGGPGAKDLDEIKDSLGTALIPEVSYRPYDNLELTMGIYLFGGKSGTPFGNLKDQDQLYFEIRRSF